MKKIRLVGMAVFALALVLGSCSGEDGKDGLPGKDGINGTNGQNGADGADGADGQNGADGNDGLSCWDINGNGTGDAEEDVNNDGNFDALDCQGADGSDGVDGVDGTNGIDGNANVQAFSYDVTLFADYFQLDLDLLNIVDTPENYAYLFYIEDVNGLRYSIPGSIAGLYINVNVVTNLSTGELTLLFIDETDDSPYIVPGGFFTKVIVVAVELTNGAKTSENVIADLKAAGVDISDYHAVAAFLGLE